MQAAEAQFSLYIDAINQGLNYSFIELPALVAQLDTHLTSDQEVASSTPTGLATFFPGDWSWNIFFGHSLPFADSRRAVVIFWQKNVHNTH